MGVISKISEESTRRKISIGLGVKTTIRVLSAHLGLNRVLSAHLGLNCVLSAHLGLNRVLSAHSGSFTCNTIDQQSTLLPGRNPY